MKNTKIHPALAVAAIVVVLAVLGFAATKFSGGGGSEGKPIVVAAPDPNDPRFRADPRLAGGGGG